MKIKSLIALVVLLAATGCQKSGTESTSKPADMPATQAPSAPENTPTNALTPSAPAPPPPVETVTNPPMGTDAPGATN
jgi:hypothetical protein